MNPKLDILKAFSVASFCVALSACSVISGRETAGEYMDDASLTAKVKTAIFEDPMLKTYQIHVESLRGEVQLSGFVGSQREKKRAEEIASKSSGVRAVQNNLTVRTSIH